MTTPTTIITSLVTKGKGLGSFSKIEKIERFNPTKDRNSAINPNRKNAKPIMVTVSFFIS